MPEAGIEIPIPAESKPTLGTVEIPIGLDKVRVSWAEFKPEGQEADSSRAVIFLPGWPLQAESKVTWDLPHSLSEQFATIAYSIDTNTSTVDSNTLRLESEGIRQFILLKRIKELTIFGHSEGAIRAANLASSLEEQNPQIQLNGVVLANPMGFYPQSFKELAKNFVFVEPQLEQQLKNPSIPHMPYAEVLMELVKGIWQDIKTARLKYPLMFTQQMRELMRVEPALQRIKAPILVLTTDKDFVSNYRRYLPEEEIEKMTTKPMFEDEKYRSMERKVSMAKAREEYTKENILPQAGPVKVLIASRYGSHIGLPVERYQQVAHVVSRIFDRMRRQKPQ